MKLTATGKDGMLHEIFLPTPERLLESIQNQRRLEEAAKRALDYLTDHAIDLEGDEEALVAEIRFELEDALGICLGEQI